MGLYIALSIWCAQVKPLDSWKCVDRLTECILHNSEGKVGYEDCFDEEISR